MKRNFYFLILIVAVAAGACKKKHSEDAPVVTGPDAPGSTLDKIKDSVFLYAKETYYWNDGLPDYASFMPRNISGNTDLTALSNEVDVLSQYKINPATGLAYEYYQPAPGEAKYSFIDNGQTSTTLGGSKADFGFAITALSNADFRVRYVYPVSPAANANVHRGEQIVTVNGRSNLDLNVTADYNFLVSALGTSPLIMTLKKADNTTYSVTLNSAAYTANPVLTYKVFDQGSGKKVGYFVFNTFTSMTNAQPKIDEAFNYFTTNNITDLVVDLRYNGGGYIETAEYLSNLIVPSAKNNTLMYNTYFNSILTSGQAQLLKNQVYRSSNGTLYNYAQIDYTVASNAVNFSKKGTLNLNRVFFIVSGSTASASELTINNLRSQMDVKLIGRTTYGKPVGFFAININKYQLYMPEFETKNSANQGGYYTGMQPGSTNYPGISDADDLTHDFGDPNENLLKHALNYVTNGAYGVNLRIQGIAEGGQPLNRNVGPEGFSGMIMDRDLKIKK